jgi:hypothetical protein
VAWAAVLLGVSVASAWRLITASCEESEHAHVNVRLLLAGIATWAATAAAFGFTAMPFAAATALLGIWHLGLAVFLRRRESNASELFLALGWLQVFTFGPIRLEHAALAWWWIAMSVTATVVPWSGLKRLRGAMLLIPALAAIGWCVGTNEPWSLFVGLLAAAVLVGASLWPFAHGSAERPIAWLAIVGTVAWSVVTLTHGPAPIVAQLTWALVPVAVFLGWACLRPGWHAQLVAAAHLGLGLFGALAAIVDSEALLLRGVNDPGEGLGIAALLLLLAGFGVAIIARARAAARLADQPELGPKLTTGIGLSVAAAVGLALLLGVAVVADNSRALGQVGYSLSVAGIGLGLIVAGLRLDDGGWRQVGLGAIAFAAAKIVLFDLSAAAVGWRALSFVGLGAILIGGSFAYSRAYRRATASA